MVGSFAVVLAPFIMFTLQNVFYDLFNLGTRDFSPNYLILIVCSTLQSVLLLPLILHKGEEGIIMKLYTRFAIVIIMIVVPITVIITWFVIKDLASDKSFHIYMVFFVWVQIFFVLYNYVIMFKIVDILVSDLWKIPDTIEGLKNTIQLMEDDDSMQRMHGTI